MLGLEVSEDEVGLPLQRWWPAYRLASSQASHRRYRSGCSRGSGGGGAGGSSASRHIGGRGRGLVGGGLALCSNGGGHTNMMRWDHRHRQGPGM